MAIKIIKKRTSDPAPAEVVEGGLAATSTRAPERTEAEIRARWLDIPPPKAKPVECAYCKHWYLRPCKPEEYQLCLNWQNLQLVALKESKSADT